jgi:predicted phage terminase large subunit-like protein
MLDRAQYYERANHYAGVLAPHLQSIDYIDPAPKPFEIKMPFVEYFERVKKLRADKWQIHFCEYLQDAVMNRHIRKNWAEFHAQAQLGKTTILSQAFPAWCLGHDPLFRITLAMYNVRRSQVHSSVVIEILQSEIHKQIFPDPRGHLPAVVSKEGWSTNGRIAERSDGQYSFNPVGLQSGMTGSGFDYLIIDDPYKEPKDAFSETVFENLKRFWEMGVKPRMQAHSCIAAMFHRYAYDDFGGFLLNTGQFDYVRYASIADGDYVHEETGQRFPDPLEREDGELISPERFPQSYYDDKNLDTRTWNSMFQGRPSSAEGDFFKVKMIGEATDAEWAQCTLKARGWDHAATKNAGDKSASAKIGMMPDRTAIVADVTADQVDTAGRLARQKELAIEDGTDTDVVIPRDKAAAGKDVVFMTEQELEGFNVYARDVTNAAPGSDAKKRRAYNFSVAVNSGLVKFLPGEWSERVKRLMRNFGAAASGDDEIDALSDAYNHLYEKSRRGLVVDFGERNLKAFNGKVPERWTVYAGVKITPEPNMPNSGVVVARASLNTNLADALFILDEYKQYTDRHEDIFAWIDTTLKTYTENPKASTIWLHKNSESYLPTIEQKLKQYRVSVFKEAPLAGITELNWYIQNKALTGFVRDESQMTDPTNNLGLAAIRQEAATWGYTDKGIPSGVGQVWDCLRMVAYAFHTTATSLTPDEKRERKLAPRFQIETIQAKREEMTPEEFSQAVLTREVKLSTQKIFNGNGASKPKTRFAKFKR